MSSLQLKDSSVPYNRDAELAVLGALLINFKGEILDMVQETVRVEDFYSQANQKIFQAIISLSNRGEAIDLLTLTEELKRDGNLEMSGGVSYLSNLTSSVPSAANVEYYAEIVKSCSLRRNLITISHNIISKAHNEAQSIDEILEAAEKDIFDINEKQHTSTFAEVRDVVKEAFDLIEERMRLKTEFTGVPTGFTDLDKKTSGFQKSEMIIVGARPSIGKTAWALNVAANITLRQNIPCGFFTLEMSNTSLMTRLLAMEARVDSSKLKAGWILKESEWNYLIEAASRFYDASLVIDDTPNIGILDLRAQARRMKKQKNIGILFIDYIGLIQTENRNIPRHEQMAEVSRSLKSLARELDIPVVVLSQVGRQTEGKEPSLADLRESGAIEQDADMVLFLHRERGVEDAGDSNEPITTKIILAKNRNGPVGTSEILFFKQFTRFDNMSHDAQ